MKCDFDAEKECNIRCQYYHTCTRSEYRKSNNDSKEGVECSKGKVTQ